MRLFSRRLFFAFFVAVLAAAAFAQKSEPLLATANGFTFTVNGLSPESKQLYEQRAQLTASKRTALFEDWIFELLLETEGKTRGLTREKIEAEELAKITTPTEPQIKAVYDANKQTIGDRPIEQVRAQIIDFLKQEAEDKQLAALFATLKTKHKYTAGKDVNFADLKPVDVVATIGTRTLTAGEFETRNRQSLHNQRAGIYEQIRADLESAIYSKLIEAEAKKQNTDASSIIAVEITNKMKDYTDYERMYLEDMLQTRLFAQYAVKLNLDAPKPFTQIVSADDDPSIGAATAKVTVVAFVDFQCSACAAFSPLMKQVAAEFGTNVRVVVRDFPLAEIHRDAMAAALAGYAARQQGKFFEMADLMYGNQSALDAESIKSYARQLGLNMEQFERDAKSEAAAAEIRKDVADGKSYGLSGTPTVFVNGVQLQRLSTGRFRDLINNALRP